MNKRGEDEGTEASGVTLIALPLSALIILALLGIFLLPVTLFADQDPDDEFMKAAFQDLAEKVESLVKSEGNIDFVSGIPMTVPDGYLIVGFSSGTMEETSLFHQTQSGISRTQYTTTYSLEKPTSCGNQACLCLFTVDTINQAGSRSVGETVIPCYVFSTPILFTSLRSLAMEPRPLWNVYYLYPTGQKQRAWERSPYNRIDPDKSENPVKQLFDRQGSGTGDQQSDYAPPIIAGRYTTGLSNSMVVEWKDTSVYVDKWHYDEGDPVIVMLTADGSFTEARRDAIRDYKNSLDLCDVGSPDRITDACNCGGQIIDHPHKPMYCCKGAVEGKDKDKVFPQERPCECRPAGELSAWCGQYDQGQCVANHLCKSDGDPSCFWIDDQCVFAVRTLSGDTITMVGH